ncbi:MAG: GHKL domain-containing protein [Bacteroidetes bacterium]|nr:GHKL domain-containing protein [Bacteroidota bacterium]
MRTLKTIIFCLSLFLFSLFAGAQTINFEDFESSEMLEPTAAYYKFIADKNPENSEYKISPLPSFQNQNGTHFIKFEIKENSFHRGPVWIKLPFLSCESIELNFIDAAEKTIANIPLTKKSSNFLFRIDSVPENSKFILFKVKSSFALFFPMKLMQNDKMESSEKRDDIVYSMYFGIVIIMSLYNLFVYFSTRSSSYLYYFAYSLTFGIAQFCLVGFFNTLATPGNYMLSKQFSIVFSGLSGVFGLFFINSFLEIKQLLPKFRKLFLLFLFSYIGVTLAGMFRIFEPVFNWLNMNGVGAGLFCLVVSAYLSLKKNRPARFYFAAWSTFILCLVLYILTNVGVAPYNGFTKFLLPLGSAIEISLLSFALADKINILSEENEMLIREQNIMLERQVAERTAELGDALENLKQTQMQLVNSEKMASLGHLTAGIAHEINNPINFISANVSPLRRDIEDYETLMDLYGELTPENFDERIANIQAKEKEFDLEYLKKEIQTLLSGIDEGAKRTAEIVKNLKIFSHIDKAEHSFYSVNEGLKSTLQLLSHKLNDIYVREDFSDLPPILCFPGKLNQVFMNILSNAIDALAGRNNPEIGVTTYLKDNLVFVDISDNGSGIPENIIKDIFNPFFTTKDVGSGTGLGLSITLAIVEEHGGELRVKSEPDKGTTFTIILPLKDDKNVD